MAFETARFIQLRPYLYHLTHRHNLDAVLRIRRLDCATRILAESGNRGVVTTKRKGALRVMRDDAPLSIRDQDPLHEGNIAFEGGWTFPQLVASLNARVYFWPGTEKGPSDYGMRHFERYRDENPVVLRLRTAEVFAANKANAPQFCKYNSGSPRWSGGNAAPRGPNRFVEAEKAPFNASEVVEVTFLEHVVLGPPVEVGDSPTGAWQKV